MSAQPSVELEDVGYVYAGSHTRVAALQHIDLALFPGKSYAIVGKSGSGKSTLVSLLALLRKATSGRVVVNGQDAAAMRDRDLARFRGTTIGVVFQSFHLDPSSTAMENVLLPWHFDLGLPGKQAKIRAHEALELMGIADLADRQTGQMSGGQRQRVAIARALLLRPSVVLADEPTGNLDEETGRHIAGHLLSLASATGTSVVMVTHDSDLASLADHSITITAGSLTGSL